ncbi:SusD/RagB family nutrient-binding outer membrane lipoprotein [Marinifilum sp.]|uniref:SusD/RagB family nutrient-binding outer membrane lipoprotein n=1 Tax=Marinifilum sp. TaxID=2033137 RepID=UPI003BA89E73
MNSLIKYITVLFIAVSLFSCTDDFEEINTNPNDPDRVSDPSLLLPEIIWDFSDANFENSFDRGAIVADQVSNFFVGSFNDWTRADVNRFSWGYYSKIYDLDYMINISEEQGLNNYRAIGMILRAWAFQSITDNFGPIPYFEAARAQDNINFPKFDAQQDIYADLLEKLEEANLLLDESKEVVNGDILFSGSIKNWKMFANGMRLRILMRQSDKIDPSAEMQKIVNDPSTYPLFESHEDQAALQYLDSKSNAHPAFRGNVSDWSSSSSTRLSYNMEVILKSMNDPRISVFALPTAATIDTDNPEYFGVPNGLLDVNDWNGGVQNHSLMGLLFAPEQYDPSLVSMNAAQSILIPYSEVQFILAEARVRGFITTGDAETYYMNGIKDQFNYYASRIPDTWLLPNAADLIPSSDYYTQETVAFTGSSEEKLNKIYTQKWLALFTVGFEAWSEWRRVHVPVITPGPATSGFIPVRYIYPADEMRLNDDNYNEAVKLLGGNGDEITSPVWWDVD